jgi:hypothetical protein
MRRCFGILGMVVATFLAGGWIYGQSTPAATPQDKPPGVARISTIRGDVSIQRGDSADWVAAAQNTPVMPGDKVSTGQDALSELQLDYANILRLSSQSVANVTTLDNAPIQIQLAQGLAFYTILKGAEANAEIDTPNVALHPRGEGEFRIQVNPAGETVVMVRKGEADLSRSRSTEPGPTRSIRLPKLPPRTRGINTTRTATRASAARRVGLMWILTIRAPATWMPTGNGLTFPITVGYGYRRLRRTGRRIGTATGFGNLITAGLGPRMSHGAGRLTITGGGSPIGIRGHGGQGQSRGGTGRSGRLPTCPSSASAPAASASLSGSGLGSDQSGGCRSARAIRISHGMAASERGSALRTCSGSIIMTTSAATRERSGRSRHDLTSGIPTSEWASRTRVSCAA